MPYNNDMAATYLGYFFLGAGLITGLVAYLGKSRKILPLAFAATMMVMGGLAMLQFTGVGMPA